MKTHANIATCLDGVGRRMAELVPAGSATRHLEVAEQEVFEADSLRFAVWALHDVASSASRPQLEKIMAWADEPKGGAVSYVSLCRTACNYGRQLVEGVFVGPETNREQRLQPLIRLALERDCQDADRVIAGTMTLGMYQAGRQVDALAVPLLHSPLTQQLPMNEMAQLVYQADELLLRQVEKP
jgi:hypothetical protein